MAAVEGCERVAGLDPRHDGWQRDLDVVVEEPGEGVGDADDQFVRLDAAPDVLDERDAGLAAMALRLGPVVFEQRRVDRPAVSAHGDLELVELDKRHLVAGGGAFGRFVTAVRSCECHDRRVLRPEPGPVELDVAPGGDRADDLPVATVQSVVTRGGERIQAAHAARGRRLVVFAGVADRGVDARLPRACALQRPWHQGAVGVQVPGAKADERLDEVGCGHPVGVLGSGSCPSRSIFLASPVGSGSSRCGRRSRRSRRRSVSPRPRARR